MGLTHIAIAAAALLACAPDAESITTIRSICVDDTTLQVQLAGCHSTECLQLESSTCTATQAGDEVRVEAEAVLTRRPYRSCDGPCRSVIARCPLPANATGSSTLWVAGVAGPALEEAGCDQGVVELVSDLR